LTPQQRSLQPQLKPPPRRLISLSIWGMGSGFWRKKSISHRKSGSHAGARAGDIGAHTGCLEMIVSTARSSVATACMGSCCFGVVSTAGILGQD